MPENWISGGRGKGGGGISRKKWGDQPPPAPTGLNYPDKVYCNASQSDDSLQNPFQMCDVSFILIGC